MRKAHTINCAIISKDRKAKTVRPKCQAEIVISNNDKNIQPTNKPQNTK